MDGQRRASSTWVIERGTEGPTPEPIERVAVVLDVQLRHLREFEHEKKDLPERRKPLDDLLKDADVATLQQAVKLLRAILV